MLTNLSLRARLLIFFGTVILATAVCVIAGLIVYQMINQPIPPVVKPPTDTPTDASADAGLTLAPPGAPDLVAGSDTGISNTDNITNNTRSSSHVLNEVSPCLSNPCGGRISYCLRALMSEPQSSTRGRLNGS